MICSGCGRQVPDARFCMVCGAAQVPAAQAPTPGPAQQSLSLPPPSSDTTVGGSQSQAEEPLDPASVDAVSPQDPPSPGSLSGSFWSDGPVAPLAAPILESDGGNNRVEPVRTPKSNRGVIAAMIIGAAAVVLIAVGVLWAGSRQVVEAVDGLGVSQSEVATFPTWEETANPVAALISANAGSYPWTYTNGYGYTVDGRFSFGQPIAIDEQAPDVRWPGSQASAGDICSLTAERDAVIPISVQLTNKSDEFAVGAAFTLAFGGRSSFSDPTLELAQDFSDEDECSAASYDFNGGGWGVQFSELLEAGDYATTNAYLIIHDFYTPDYPNGNTSWLSSLVAQALPAVNANTGDKFTVSGNSVMQFGADVS